MSCGCDAPVGGDGQGAVALSVDEAGIEDLEGILDVFTASFIPMVRGYHPRADSTTFAHTTLRALWQKILTDGASTVWLARERRAAGDTTDPLAVMSVKPSSRAATLELVKLFVRPERQGSGVGRQLTELALRFAADNRYEHLELWTWKVSHQSRRFYESMGFCCTGDRGVSGYPGIDPAADITLRYDKRVRPGPAESVRD